jgi:hypothetical protein
MPKDLSKVMWHLKRMSIPKPISQYSIKKILFTFHTSESNGQLWLVPESLVCENQIQNQTPHCRAMKQIKNLKEHLNFIKVRIIIRRETGSVTLNQRLQAVSKFSNRIIGFKHKNTIEQTNHKVQIQTINSNQNSTNNKLGENTQ